jgi:excisionase family DNA binding protein
MRPMERQRRQGIWAGLGLPGFSPMTIALSGARGTHMTTNTNSHSTPSDLAHKQVFTTGEAAEVCKVSQQTIIRCFDSGRLKGFRVPGSRFRRIPREELVRFMRENNIPTDLLEGGKKRILVVDDDEQIIDLFIDVLTREGRYDVKTASTGYDAGVLTQQFKPDLMILDFMLPDINGNVVCRTVRQNPDLSGMKIIIVSGVVKQDEIDELIKLGADEFVKKPFNLEKLLARIGELLEV